VNFNSELHHVISKEDAILIKRLYLSKGYGSRKLMDKFVDEG